MKFITITQGLKAFTGKPTRGVVVPESGGAPFQQIFFEPEWHSSKYCLSQLER